MKRKKAEPLPKELQLAIKRFPKHIAEKSRKAKARQLFLQKTFGAIVLQLQREQRKKKRR